MWYAYYVFYGSSMSCFFVFFFFKQKTVYEMRISDWSSDVCSSDLNPTGGSLLGDEGPAPRQGRHSSGFQDRQGLGRKQLLSPFQAICGIRRRKAHPGQPQQFARTPARPRTAGTLPDRKPGAAVSRSEEHTSELQSLMRISYA